MIFQKESCIIFNPYHTGDKHKLSGRTYYQYQKKEKRHLLHNKVLTEKYTMPWACGCDQNTNSERLSCNSESQIKLILIEPTKLIFWEDTGEGSHHTVNGLDKCLRPC